MTAEIVQKADANFTHALDLFQRGQIAEARELCEDILRTVPNHSRTLHLLGVISSQANYPERAVDLLGRAIMVGPVSAALYVNYGNSLLLLGRYEPAIASYDRAISLNGADALAHYSRGNALRSLGRYRDAIKSCDRAISLDAGHAQAHLCRATCLLELKEYGPALSGFDAAISISPTAESYRLRGNALLELGLGSAAIASYENALALQPTDAEIYNSRGVARSAMRQFELAISDFDKAVSIAPNHASYHYNRGNALQRLHRHEAAVASYDRALALAGDVVRGHYNRGNSLSALREYEAAIASYDLALRFEVDTRFLRGARLFARMQICNWDGLQEEVELLVAAVESNEAASAPFYLLFLSGSPRLQYSAAQVWGRLHAPARPLPPIPTRTRKDRIRIGYFSPDFHNHPVSMLIAELIEIHDRSRFEVFAFSFGHSARDELRARLEHAFDRFIDVRNKSDIDIALLARELEIDIAVDLAGYTESSRDGIFAVRAAPVQVSYLGYPGTMGVDYMDYLMADRTVIPIEHESHYAERIIFLPNSYLPNDSTRYIPNTNFRRSEFGLPRDGFVFCCFNNCYKIAPSAFDSWMRILRQVEGSVLWLSLHNTVAATNLRRSAQQRGVDPERLIFSERVASPAEHLARHRLADLFLDTLPYNAHATAIDALWAGLPLLTRIGTTFAGRVAASLLKAIGLPELITSSPQDYEALAVRLAGDPGLLAHLRRRLVANQLTTPLFDAETLTRHIESAYRRIYDRCQENKPPQHVYLDST